MKVRFCFVPPGGGEQDFGMEVELPAVPRIGDYIVIERELKGDSLGTNEGFIVRRNWWKINESGLRELVVEAEFAEASFATEDHQASLKMYANRGHVPQQMDWSGY